MLMNFKSLFTNFYSVHRKSDLRILHHNKQL
jgi:hypothetical protein